MATMTVSEVFYLSNLLSTGYSASPTISNDGLLVIAFATGNPTYSNIVCTLDGVQMDHSVSAQTTSTYIWYLHVFSKTVTSGTHAIVANPVVGSSYYTKLIEGLLITNCSGINNTSSANGVKGVAITPVDGDTVLAFLCARKDVTVDFTITIPSGFTVIRDWTLTGQGGDWRAGLGVCKKHDAGTSSITPTWTVDNLNIQCGVANADLMIPIIAGGSQAVWW